MKISIIYNNKVEITCHLSKKSKLKNWMKQNKTKKWIIQMNKIHQDIKILNFSSNLIKKSISHKTLQVLNFKIIKFLNNYIKKFNNLFLIRNLILRKYRPKF
jgi:hypothetical protein